MNQRDKVIELLKLYPSYKYAVRMYETTGWVAISGTQYSDMPRGGGFGSKAPVKFMVDSFLDTNDYHTYKRTVELIEGAMDTLMDEERSVIRLKWLGNLTLAQIAMRKWYSERTIQRAHKKGLQKLAICLRFVEAPEIEQIPVA